VKSGEIDGGQVHTDDHASELETLSNGLSVDLIWKIGKAYKAERNMMRTSSGQRTAKQHTHGAFCERLC
jgi:hypothetical protein